ncbi:TetR/AcrR family transcriptional regulator [Nocardia veterana]|uniref:TetR/AcrR family transcriptional regulator n=2 Tax=Nocardia veterana TaxID=132249 RepID=A0A7X6M1C1_9NOCA|nr:TetR/AcrR family transcriptional regulator [Nocardia veterana]
MGLPTPRRPRADAARNHSRILRAATDLFAERGLEVTLDNVAEAAGVGVGTVYRHFSDKKRLVAEAFEQTVTAMAEATESAFRDPDTWRGLTRLFEWYCEHMAANRGFGEVMLELPDAEQRFASVRERIRPMVLGLIDKALAEGVLRPGVTATDLFAMVNMVESIAGFARPVNPDVWRRYMSIVLDGVRADPVPRTPLAAEPLTADEVARAKAALVG